MVLESNTLDVLFVKDGQQGEDGKILYTWIKYAKDASGTGMTDDPDGAIYIGISYNNESSIESNDPTHYAWTKIQGADGKKGEDAYTIFLENENISFATDANRNPLSEQAYTSGITIMKGAKPVTDFTIGDIAKTQGIAVAKTDTAIAISVVNGNPLPNDSGEIEIPITVGGTVFKKILTWTCAKKGEKGEQGEKGKNGTSVTIKNKSITYQLSTSGTTAPTGTWQTSPQTIPEGQYQWTKTSVAYSDGNKTESYSISYHGKNGSDGTSVKTTSTSVKYQVGDSGTTKPTGTWQSNVPTVAQGRYLWTQTIVNYSDGNSTESYSVSYRGIDGSNGINGMNTATVYLYQRATSTPSKPSNTLTYTFSTTKITGTLNNGWSTAIPTGTDAVYVTVASVSSKNDTATIATSVWSAPVVLAQNGKTGSDGKAGLNVATIYLYQRNTSKPSKPSASVTYTFSTGVASGLNNGWSQKIPDGTNPLYVTLATASSNTATDTILSSEWSDVAVMAQNGEDGQDGISPKVSLSKSGDTTTISIVDATGTHTQTVKDGTNGTPGAAGKDGKTSYFHVKYSNDGGKTFTGNSGEDTGIYMGSYTDYTEVDSTDVKKYNWVKVSGDNFSWNLLTKDDCNMSQWTNIMASWLKVTNNEYNNIISYTTLGGGWEIIYKKISVEKGKKYVLSFDYKVNKAYNYLSGQKYGVYLSTSVPTDTPTNIITDGQYVIENTVTSIKRGMITFSAPADTLYIVINGGCIDDNQTGLSFEFNKWKLEKGTIASPWAPHKDDLQGEKGDPGTSIKITSKSVTYQVSTSGTTAPTGTWSTTVPTVNNGQYLWTKTTVQYSDDNKTEAYSVSYKGTNGTNGTSVTVNKTEVTYQVSTSGTTAPTGVWSTTMPSCDQGQYLWTKTYVKYSDGKDTTSYSVSYKGVDGEKFAFNMLRETNQGSKHWENHASGGKYTTESIITEDGINAVKLICTEAIPSGGWQYVSFDDYQMLKSLKPSTDYVISFDIKSNLGTRSSWVSIQQGDSTNAMLPAAMTHIKGNETWEHICVFLRSNDTLPKINGQYIYITSLGGVGYSIIKNLKLTEGIVDTPWAPHPEDLEGRGVSETVQYYLATSQASGVTSSTSGWSTDITTQKLTADKKYLWNCYQTKYSDGTSEPISTPKVIGVYGDKGQKGDNAKNLSITPSSQYFKSTDGGKTFAPDTITIKPTIQGEISFGKWQYSIDGGVSFADIVSEQKGLTISNNVLTVSKDSSLYSDAVTMVTFRAVANDSSFYDTCSIAKIYDVSDIGDGRNLLWNSNFAKTDEAITGTTNSWGLHTRGTNLVASIDTSTKHNGSNTLKTVSAANGDKNSSNDLEWFAWGIPERTSDNLHSKNQNYTLSFYAKASVATDFIVRWGYDAYGADTTRTLTTNWQQYEIKLHQATSAYSISIIFKLLTAGTVWFSEFKLEKGSSATGYSTAPEDVQTAILSTKNSIESVSSTVNKQKKQIEDKVSKTTYETDLKVLQGDLSKANEGLNKWRYEIYPKSLFKDEDQSKYTIDIFATNQNLVPSQTVLLDDSKLSTGWDYGDNHIAYALTFIKMSAKKDITTKMFNDDNASLYVNGKLIVSRTSEYTNGQEITFTLAEGWNCIEVVVNEVGGGEGFRFSTTLSTLSECQMMNCYYGTPVARQSRITNQLVQNTTDIDGVSGSVQKVMSTVGGSGKIDEFVSNYSTWKKKVDGIETRVGETYTTKSDFDGLEIGGRNLVLDSKPQKQGSSYAVVSRHLSVDLQAGVTYTISFCGRVVDGDGSLAVYLHKYDWKDSIQKSTKSKENTVISWQFTPKISGAFKIEAYSFLSQDVAGGNVYLDWFKVEKGNKATDWTPAPEDDEINGQNLVSNLPDNWEQGSVNVAAGTAGKSYSDLKLSASGQIRTKELIPVSNDIVISAISTQNSNKKNLQTFILYCDVNKKSLGTYENWTNVSHTLNVKDVRYVAVLLKYEDNSAITPSDISKICLKIERGTSATPFTLAPEDVNGKIVNVETIANQTAKKFEWIVKGGDKSSSMVLTDDFLNIVANNINLTGKVTFNSLSTDAKNEIGKVAQSKVDDLEVGGRNLLVQKNITEGYLSTDGKGSFVGSGGGDQTSDWIDVAGNKYITITLYEDFTNTNNSGRYCEYDADKNCINTVDYNPRQKSSIIIELKSNTKYIRVTAIECKTRRYKIEKGNKATDWTPAPEDVSQDATNKANQALTDAKSYSSSAVNWVTNNGASTTNLNSMVKKWTDGAVSDTTQINGGWLKTNTITASKIAIGDFTNYADINESNTYWFRVEQTKEGTWFYRDGSELQRDNVISELHTCRGGETFYVEYDISNTIKEGDKYKYAGLMIFGYDGNGGTVSYNRNAGVTATANGEITHITTQLTMPDTTRSFRVYLQIEGYTPFTGTLKIRNISVRKAVTGNLIVDGAITAYKIATDAIKSRNYVANSTGSFLNLTDGTFDSKYLKWDKEGKITATSGTFTNVDITGKLIATSGRIGKFNIAGDNSYMKAGSGSTAAGMGGNQAFWAGGDDSNSAPFRVSYGGQLVADGATLTQAHVSGEITATSGQIGDLILKRGSLTSTGKLVDSEQITTDYLMTMSKSGVTLNSTVNYGTSEDGTTFIEKNDIKMTPDGFKIINDGARLIAMDATGFSIKKTNSEDYNVLIDFNGCMLKYGDSSLSSLFTEFLVNFSGISISCDNTTLGTATAVDINDSGLSVSSNITEGTQLLKDKYAAKSHEHWYLKGGNYRVGVGSSTARFCTYNASDNNAANKKLSLGDSNALWTRVYAANATISTSDERLKEEIKPQDERYEKLFNNLIPVTYRWKNEGSEQGHDRVHTGFISQQVKCAMDRAGLSDKEFAAFCYDDFHNDPEWTPESTDGMTDKYSLAYEEFISLNTHMIQKTRKELTDTNQEIISLKKENAELKETLKSIMKKLNM